jgi:hypothetical protein
MEEITRHLGSQLDTEELEKEIKAIEKELEALEKNEELQYNILSQIGLHGKYKNIKEDKILAIIDKLTEQRELGERRLQSNREDLRAVEQNKLNSETIHLILENFEKALEYATVEQRKELVRSLVKEVKLGFIEGTEKGVEPISITLNFTGEQIDLMCDSFGVKESYVETVVLLSHKDADGLINVKMEYEDGVDRLPERVTYSMIQAYVEGKYGFKVHTAYIAEVKRSLGLPMYEAPNAVDELKHPYKPAPAHKVEAIKDALKHFGVYE